MILFSVFSSEDSQAVDKAHLRWLRDKPVIDSIVIEGNEYFTDSHIKKRMYSRENSIWKVIKGDRRRKIQRETPERDSLEIKFIYLSKGFLNISVVEFFEMRPDSSALIRVGINEGKQYFYGDKQIKGNYPEELQHGFNKIADGLKKGKPLNLFEVQQAGFAMKTILANEGYPYARISHIVDTAKINDLPPLIFYIDSDSLTHFGKVEIEGIDRYPEYTARREVKINNNDIYRRRTILDSQRRLFESGYFSTLQLNHKKENLNRLQPDFVLRVRERKPKYFTLQTGAGQSVYKDLIWDISSGFGKRNFLGSRRYDILADYSLALGDGVELITHRYRLRFTEPWFIGLRMPLAITGEWEPTLKDPVQDYLIRSWSLSVASQKRFGHKIRTTVGLEYESIKISGASAELEEIIKAENLLSVRRKLYLTFRRDSRDNIFLPRRGSVTEIIGEYYGGILSGDDNFTHLEVSWSRYMIVWPGWISATRIKLGSVEAFGNSSVVPINDRLYLGGANSIRAFRENTLGPVGSDNLPLGADFTVVFNQEFRWKTLQLFSVIPVLNDLLRTFPLWQSVFVDVGNGFSDHRGFHFNHLALSYGTGLQLVSPAGPIRVDYARRIKTDYFDFADRWHFTILYAF